jgi:ABC-2 type transport system permease protein
MAFWMIILVLVISLAWFAALSFLTARWFEKKEVG